MLTTRFSLSLFLLAMIMSAGVASGQNYPNKPIRIFTSDAGGASDIGLRLIAPEISSRLGQPVIVENMPSIVLAETLLRTPADGYTAAFGGSVIWLTQLTQKTPYDAVRDFSPITMVETYPHLLVVNSSVSAKSVKELIELARSKPGELNIAGAASPGGESYLAAELFKAMAGVNMVRVPYKGNAAALLAVMATEAQLMFIDTSSVTAHLKSGKLRALAVTSLGPSPLAPGLPTVSASGVPGYESGGILGIVAPAGTPAANINRLNQEIVRVLARTDMKEKFFGMGAEVVGNSPEQFSAKIKSEITKWGKVLRDAGVKPES